MYGRKDSVDLQYVATNDLTSIERNAPPSNCTFLIREIFVGRNELLIWKQVSLFFFFVQLCDVIQRGMFVDDLHDTLISCKLAFR